MSQNSESTPGTLRQYVNDQAALATHIVEALERQHDDSRVQADPKVFPFVKDALNMFRQHAESLHKESDRLGSGVGLAAKGAVAHAAGVVAGLYDKVRKDPVSRMLRDDYTAFNLASVSYTMLHTTGLAYGDHPVADAALHHLRELTPLIIRINEIVPFVVNNELKDNGAPNHNAAEEALQNTQQAWK